jgi:hypothetical protein
VPAARRAVHAVATKSLEVEGTELVAVDDVPGCREVRMLGEFDAYLLGYQDRRQELPPSIFPGGGILRPAVVQAGRAIGSWRHSDLSVDLFDPPADVSAELSDLARFAG